LEDLLDVIRHIEIVKFFTAILLGSISVTERCILLGWLVFRFSLSSTTNHERYIRRYIRFG